MNAVLQWIWSLFTTPVQTTPVSEETKPIIKKKKAQIPNEIRDQVWLKYHGIRTTGICYCCGTPIEKYNGWHCSHVLSEDKGGPTRIDNLRTCCRHCNLSMGNQNLYTYIRDKNLQGPGKRHMNSYFTRHNSQLNDRRTNNWGKQLDD